jgi:hypothetical protein
MASLRIHRGDDTPPAAPQPQPDGEYYGRTPAGLQRVTGINTAAKHVYSVITRLMAQYHEPTHCTNNMATIAFESGLTIRYTRRLIRDLETAGYVERERLRERKQSPMGIRPLIRLKMARNLDASNRLNRAGRPAQESRETGSIEPGDRLRRAAPLKREGDKEIIQIAGTSHGGKKAPATAPPEPPEPPPTPEEIATAEALKARVADLARRLAPPDARGARKRPGVIGQDPPEASQSAINGSQNDTAEPPQPSSQEHEVEHKFR